MISLYKPNSKNTGAALSISAGNAQTKDRKNLPYVSGSVFLKIAKQCGWDEDSRTGFFKDSFSNKDSNISVLLGTNEIAEILQCFRDKRAINNVQGDYSNRDSILNSTKKASFFHRTKNGDKSIKLYPAKEGCSDGSFVFGVSDITNKVNIGMILSSSEVRMMEEAFQTLLFKYYSREIDEAVAYFTKNQNNQKPKSAPSSRKTEGNFDSKDSGSNSQYDEDEFDTGTNDSDDSIEDDDPF
jgi:hypothetical protein